MHAISSYRGNRPHTPIHRQDRLQYTAPQLARCVKTIGSAAVTVVVVAAAAAADLVFVSKGGFKQDQQVTAKAKRRQ